MEWIKPFIQRTKEVLFVESWTDLLIQWLSQFQVSYWVICTVAGLTIFFSSNNFLVHKNKWEEIAVFGNLTILFFYLSLSFLVGYGLFLAHALDNQIKPSLQKNILFPKEFEGNDKHGVTPTLWKRISFVIKNLLIFSIFILSSDYTSIVIVLALLILDMFNSRNVQSESSPSTTLSSDGTSNIFSRNERTWNYLFGVIRILLILYLLFHLLFYYAEVFALIVFLVIVRKTSKIIFSINKLRTLNLNFSILDLSPLYQLSQLTQKITLYLLPLTFSWLMINLTIATAYLLLSLFMNHVDFITDIFSFQRLQQVITLDVISVYNQDPLLGRIILFSLINPIFILLIEVFIFTQPILWTREKIIASKNALLSEIGQKLQAVFLDQDKSAEEKDFKRVTELRDYANALISRKEYIQKISVWPWEGRVFREFLTSLLIPLILLILQFLIARWLGI